MPERAPTEIAARVRDPFGERLLLAKSGEHDVVSAVSALLHHGRPSAVVGGIWPIVVSAIQRVTILESRPCRPRTEGLEVFSPLGADLDPARAISSVGLSFWVVAPVYCGADRPSKVLPCLTRLPAWCPLPSDECLAPISTCATARQRAPRDQHARLNPRLASAITDAFQNHPAVWIRAVLARLFDNPLCSRDHQTVEAVACKRNYGHAKTISSHPPESNP